MTLFTAQGQNLAENRSRTRLSGRITSTDNEIIDFASVYLKNTQLGAYTNGHGEFVFGAPQGQYILVVSAIGYETVEMPVQISGRSRRIDIELKPSTTEIEEVVVSASGVERVNKSAYNVIAVDAKSMHNSTLDLAHALVRVPGVKLRESGGVGSDLQFTLDGFSGKHIKFFMDGVPMEGIGSSFGINNIPINFAERIEVYKGVVPVGFGADALGGVVNIVTGNTNRQRTFVDASYSYGSFNTHKSYINFGHTTKSGFMFEVNAFQNYSDNNYKITQNNITNFEWNEDTQNWDRWASTQAYEKVKRFPDTYHNETLVGKLGVVGKSWADRLVFSMTYAQSDKDVQNGVKQEIVYGMKKTKSHSVMPSVQYLKRNLFTEGLDVNLSANYNYNVRHNIDTSAYYYNWRGERIYTGSLGEQTYQNAKYDEDNWSGTFTANYRIGERHGFVLNHVLTAFDRKAQENAASSGATSTAAVPKSSRKNITGLSYRFSVDQRWNLSVFGKYYNQSSKGPVNTNTSGGYDYQQFAKKVDVFGYGAAGTYFWKDLQFKLSYENAYRLPTNDEMFGDEDLEQGSAGLKPEQSDNFNLNITFGKNYGQHSVFAEVGLLYRDTKDYLMRTLEIYSGGLNYGEHQNHGKVRTEALNAGLHYGYANRLSVGGNLTMQNIRDREKNAQNDVENLSVSYGERMKNVPYFFFNGDASYYFPDLGGKGNVLTLHYDNLYVKSFYLEWPSLGNRNKSVVPTQFSHNLSVMYSLQNGRYNFTLECRNFTNEKGYDNFS
ncbi:MAG: carboxypeptidase-like regulatory domain-containing protein, partial [Rikenellaceae bacterium]|nr:carboxypeptidase-like regulatory domain-containing protein [Rikenellaceae bacterium]